MPSRPVRCKSFVENDVSYRREDRPAAPEADLGFSNQFSVAARDELVPCNRRRYAVGSDAQTPNAKDPKAKE